MRRIVLTLLVLAALLVGSGACGPDENAPVSELSKDDRGEAKEAARESVKGIFTAEESDCIVDAVFERDDVTPRQILDYAKKPDSSSPVEGIYQQAVPPCVDPDATIDDPGPMSAEMRSQFIRGATESGDLTEEQATCLLDALTGSGYSPRDLMLAGYFPEKQQQLTAKVPEVAGQCFATNP
jgi:hypothetical protein